MEGTLARLERNSYAIAGFGQNMVITFVTTFMLVYLVEAVGFSPRGIAVLTVLIGAIKAWDAVADLAMGVLVDSTRTRWGKLRPWILFTAIPVSFLTIMIFSIPSLPEGAMLAWFGVAYLAWGMAYTMCDVPYWGLSGVLTSDSAERTSLISFARALGTLALGVTTLAGPWIARALSSGPATTREGWTGAATLVAIAGMGVFTLAFFGTRERVAPTPPRGIVPTVRGFLANRPLLIVLLGSVLGFGRSVIQVGGAVVALIVFGDEGLFTVLGAVLIAALVTATVITPTVLRLMSKKALMTGSSLLSALVYLLMWIVGYGNFALVLGLLFLSGLCSGFFIVVQTAMIADTVDWLEFKSGERNEGVSFAGLTFVSKLMGALATLAFGFAIATVGYSKGILPTPAMKDGVWAAISLVPALSCLAGALPFAFYPLTEKRLAEIMPAILTRRQERHIGQTDSRTDSQKNSGSVNRSS